MKFKDRVVIVTGGAGGVGAAACRLFAQEGARVVVADLNMEGANAVAEEIGGIAKQTDVSSEASIVEMIDVARNRFGRLDVLFNNAGVGFSASNRYKMASIVDTPEDAWDKIIAINAKSVALGCKHGLPLLAEGGGGAVVNTASIMAISALSGADAYTASKGAIVSLTRVLATDWISRNIRVNCICPGGIETDMVRELLTSDERRKSVVGLSPINRAAKPEEVAKVAVFLASDDASYVNGVILPVDGGWNAL